PPRKLIPAPAPLQMPCSYARANDGRDARSQSDLAIAQEDDQTVLNTADLFDDEVHDAYAHTWLGEVESTPIRSFQSR
ncbi:hypothetical protein OBBRIDRAFT_799630, partial [Obba rivulosa]